MLNASPISSVPSISLGASAPADSAAGDSRQDRHERLVATLRMWALTLAILTLPLPAIMMLSADPAANSRLASSEIRRAQVLAAHAARSERPVAGVNLPDASRN